MTKNRIFTKKANQLINKKMRNEKLSQQDSNYLSRFIRPKLRDMININAETLLKKLEYNPKSLSIERKIRKIVLSNVPQVNSIALCGSAIQNNYMNYNDIDVIIATKNIFSKQKKEELINKINQNAKKEKLNLDIQIYSKKSIIKQYPHSPSLIYQLKDSKFIYGKLKIPGEVELKNLDLKIKLDWSEDLDNYSKPNEIYYAIRNALLVKLLMNRIVDNSLLAKNLELALGYEIVKKLKNNSTTNIEKKLALNYLKSLVNYLNEELNKSKWEKIEIEKH